MRTLNVAKAVGWVTFLEILRDKVLYNIIVCAFLLLSVGFLASRLTIIQPERVILDFGLSAVGISCLVIGIFTGSSLLIREFDRRTIYVALCHPISRGQFVFGKFCGISLILLINWLLLSLSYLVILYYSSPAGLACITGSLLVALFLVFLQSLVLSCVSLFLSTFSTTSLSAMISIGIYLIGTNVTQIRWVASKLKSSLASGSLYGASYLIPNLEFFNLGTRVTYGLPVEWYSFGLSMIYTLFVIVLLLTISGFLIQGREV
jgi:ABC-type transport system involved in multi-copper enzyme maturation permease subunit